MVPCSPSSGLMQFVENTLPLGDWLTGKNRMGGAHKRHQKAGDITFYEASARVWERGVGGAKVNAHGLGAEAFWMQCWTWDTHIVHLSMEGYKHFDHSQVCSL